MAKANDAADAIRRMARQYEQMVEAADILDKIGSAEGHLKELNAQIEDAKSEAKKAKDAEKKAKDSLKATNDAADAVVIAATGQGKDLVKAAEEHAAEIERTAQDKAAAMVAQASLEVSRLSAANADNISKARAELNEIQANRATIVAQAEAKAKELADIEKALDKAKAKIAQLIA